MRSFLKDYENPNGDRINYGLMNREYDDDLVNYIVDSCKSLEILKYITFVGYEYVTDQSQIDLNNYISTRKKKNKNVVKYMNMKDNRYAELRLKFRLTCKGVRKTEYKNILLPIPDENGYYTIKGNKYFLMYQLVDSSTYTTRHSLILKSLMPVSIRRKLREFKDTTGTVHSAATFHVMIFKKEVELFLFYFSKIGVHRTLRYFSVDKIVEFVNKERDPENNLYFSISSKILVEVNKKFFLKYSYIRSVVFMILSIVSNRLTFDNLEEKSYWIEKMGSLSATNAYNYYEKGLNTLMFFGRMIDESTKKILKLHAENKNSIFSVIKWVVQNYSELRKKDNLDLSNKRLRCNEYIASLLTIEFSKRVNRVISAGNKVTLDKVRDIFKFHGDVILNNLYKSGLKPYEPLFSNEYKKSFFNCGNYLRA